MTYGAIALIAIVGTVIVSGLLWFGMNASNKANMRDGYSVSDAQIEKWSLKSYLKSNLTVSGMIAFSFIVGVSGALLLEML